MGKKIRIKIFKQVIYVPDSCFYQILEIRNRPQKVFLITESLVLFSPEWTNQERWQFGVSTSVHRRTDDSISTVHLPSMLCKQHVREIRSECHFIQTTTMKNQTEATLAYM